MSYGIHQMHPFWCLAYILLFSGYFRTLCALWIYEANLLWVPDLLFFGKALYFDTKNESHLAPFLFFIQ